MPQSIENDAILASNNPYMRWSIPHTRANIPPYRICPVRDLYCAKSIPSLRNTRLSRNHLRHLEHRSSLHNVDVGASPPTASTHWGDSNMEFRVKSVCELNPQNCDFFCSACNCPDPEPLQVVKQFIAYLYAALLLLMLPTMLAYCSHCYHAGREIHSRFRQG